MKKVLNTTFVVIYLIAFAAIAVAIFAIAPSSVDPPKTSQASQTKTVTLFDIFLVRKIFNVNDLKKIIAMDEESPCYCITANGPYSIDGNVLYVKNIRVMCYTSASVFGNKLEDNMLSPVTVEIEAARVKLNQYWLSCIVLEKIFRYKEGTKKEQVEYYITVYGKRKAYALNCEILLPRTKVDS